MRVSVVGSSGAGKTTFGRELATKLGVSFIELDAIFHQPNWTQLPDDEFCRRVESLVRAESWVCDGNYAVVRPIVLGRATDVVWLDPPKSVVMAQVTWRSLSRAVTRQELWNGNRERATTWLQPDHPIRWAWTHFDRKRTECAARFALPEHAHLVLHRVQRRRDGRNVIAQMANRPR